MNATWTRLPNGAWGIRIPGRWTYDPAARIATVRRKSGEVSEETVNYIVSSDDTCTICAIVPRESARERDERERDERNRYHRSSGSAVVDYVDDEESWQQ